MILRDLFLYCAVFTVLVKIFAGKSPLDCLYFYPKRVQERVYELGLTDEETVRKKRKVFLIVFTLSMLVLLIIAVRYLEGVRDLKTAYFRCLLFLEVMNIFDGIVIDKIWVAKDPFWKIEEVKEIPYVQTWKEVFVKRGKLALIWIVLGIVPALLVSVL